ncbi:phosphatase PAP2 family protein [bacterium]|nr:MAG: phosphatase PAP2 family protein [bacterium]
MEHRFLPTLLPFLYQWGYFALFLLTFLESSAFLGLLVPGESAVVIAGLLASRNILDLGDVIWVASLGAILGDTVGYALGRWFGEPFFLKQGRFFFFEKASLEEAKRFFDKHGGKVVFFGRFVAWLRAFAPVVAGISRMPYFRFLFFNVLGGILWAAAFSLLGYFVGNSWERIQGYLGQIGLVAFVIGAMALYLYFVFIKKRGWIRKKIGRIDRTLAARMPKGWDFVKDRFRAGEWYGLNLTLSLIFLLLTVLSFGEIIEDLVDRETLYSLDFTIQKEVERIMTPRMTRIMLEITSVGGVYFTLGTLSLILIYLLRKGRRWDLFTIFLAVGMGEALLWLIKLLFHRARPVPQRVAAFGYSFPSGHAFFAMIVYGFLIYVTWKWMEGEILRWTLFSLSILFILLIGVSRIYLNAHWLTDVLGGYTAGLAWLLLSVLMVNTMKQLYHR